MKESVGLLFHTSAPKIRTSLILASLAASSCGPFVSCGTFYDSLCGFRCRKETILQVTQMILFFIRVPLFALQSKVQPVSNGRGTVLKSNLNALTKFLVLDHSVTCCRFTANLLWSVSVTEVNVL